RPRHALGRPGFIRGDDFAIVLGSIESRAASGGLIMNRSIIRIVSLLGLLCEVLFCSAACAQDIAGDWQGALKVGARELRLIVHIDRGDGAWRATLASIDQSPDRGATIAAESITVQGADVKISV